MNDPEPSTYAPLLIAALEHERACYATVLQVEGEQAKNADARLTEEYSARVQEARARWAAATALVAQVQRMLHLHDVDGPVTD